MYTRQQIIELNFCDDSAGRVFAAMAVVVPRAGETVSIQKKDYKITSVHWAIDYAERRNIDERQLRATLQIEPVEVQ